MRDQHIHHIGMALLCELKEANVVGRLYADSLATVLAMQLPIAEIVLRVELASQSHFTTTFRRLAWTTPKALREML